MKKITFEELYEKLLDFYKGKFPHNPSGVLQFHIDRIVKEGKLKEDALVELSKQAGMEIPENITGKFPEISVACTRTSVELLQKPVSLDFKAIIGIILGIVGAALTFIPLGLSYYYAFIPLWVMLIGYMLYIVGRISEHSGLTLLSSLLILSTASFWLMFSLQGWSLINRLSQLDPEYTPDLSFFLSFFICGGFGVLTGVLGFLDGIRMSNAEYTLSKKIMGPKSQPTYPRDLITKYRRQYPHNPTGVLEWHIDKKMKTGKTREQAIEELMNESK